MLIQADSLSGGLPTTNVKYTLIGRNESKKETGSK